MLAKEVKAWIDEKGLQDSVEPVFILRGQDAIAPAIIEKWISFYASLSVTCDTTRNKVESAWACASAMRRWPTRKIPD